LEPDEEIFEAVLKPYSVAVPEQQEREDSTTDSDSEEDAAPTKKKSRRIYYGTPYNRVSICHRIMYFFCNSSTDIFFLFRIIGFADRLKRNANVYLSPPSSFALPSYAEHIAQDFIRAPSPILSDGRRQRYRPTVLRFMDIEADQCDESFDAGSP